MSYKKLFSRNRIFYLNNNKNNKEKEKKIKFYSFFLYSTVPNSVFNKSRIATLITSDRFGYTFKFTNSSMPERYATLQFEEISNEFGHMACY